jgi:hypothetical protein
VKRFLPAGLVALLAGTAFAGLLTVDRGGRGAATSAAADFANMTSNAENSTCYAASTDVTGHLWEGSAGELADGIVYTTAEHYHCAGAAEHRYLPGTGAESNPGGVVYFLDSSWGTELEDGVGTNVGVDPPATIEWAMAVKMDANLRSGTSSGDLGYSEKLAILSQDGNSCAGFEVVWQNSNGHGWVNGYHRCPPDTTSWEVDGVADRGCGGGEFQYQPLMDRGVNALTDLAAVNPDDSSAWTDCEKALARYGGLYQWRSMGFPDAAAGTRLWKFWEQLDPENDDIGPILWPADDWFWLKQRIELAAYGSHANNDIYWYIQRRGDADWVLVHHDEGVTLSQDSEAFGLIRFNAVWHTTRRNDTTEAGSIFYGAFISDIDGDPIPAAQWWPPQ